MKLIFNGFEYIRMSTMNDKGYVDGDDMSLIQPEANFGDHFKMSAEQGGTDLEYLLKAHGWDSTQEWVVHLLRQKDAQIAELKKEVDSLKQELEEWDPTPAFGEGDIVEYFGKLYEVDDVDRLGAVGGGDEEITYRLVPVANDERDDKRNWGDKTLDFVEESTLSEA